MSLGPFNGEWEHEADRLRVAMEYVQAAVVSVFATAGVTLPDRVVFTAGLPVIDCEQVAISVIQAYIGTPGGQTGEPVKCNSPRSVVLQVQIARCVPTISQKGTPPTADAITASTFELTKDAYLLLKAVNEMDPVGTGVIADVTMPEPEGGLGGAVLTLTMSVP